ncbi:hypothetical protein THRCLA_02333 [Thraustotheca clavata]|uniref:NET domain-containing protein n=1 Tax=Thraustotheca clavata TaxID=74557 RepID=A0A1W0A5V0_9STRA|nr:hypothetical protein THRCLA_02333 [Thraustotheca clavata]
MYTCMEHESQHFAIGTTNGYQITRDALSELVYRITLLPSDALENLLNVIAAYEPNALSGYDEIELDLERMRPQTIAVVAQFVWMFYARSQFSLNRSAVAKAALPQSSEVQRRHRVSLIGRLFQSHDSQQSIYQPPPLHPNTKPSKNEVASLREGATESLTNTMLISMRPEELSSIISNHDEEKELAAYDDPERDVADPKLYEMLKRIQECVNKIQRIKIEVEAACPVKPAAL